MISTKQDTKSVPVKTYMELVVDEHHKILISAIYELYTLSQAEIGKSMTRDEADTIVSEVLTDMGFTPLVEMWRKVVQDASG